MVGGRVGDFGGEGGGEVVAQDSREGEVVGLGRSVIGFLGFGGQR